MGDNADDMCVLLYSDADYAGDVKTAKGTSGTYIAIVGPRAFMPICALSKKQTCVSHSSTESEIIAAEYGVRIEGLQILTCWEHVVQLFSKHRETLGWMRKQNTASEGSTGVPVGGITPKSSSSSNSKYPETQIDPLRLNPEDPRFNPLYYYNETKKLFPRVNLIIAEDNEAVIKIIAKARSTALRHLPRTHRIDVEWLFEVCSAPEVTMRYVNTKFQLADIMTKGMTKGDLWTSLIELTQIRKGKVPDTLPTKVPDALQAPVGISPSFSRSKKKKARKN